MEEWSAAEANLFEEAIDKYGKDFNDIRQDFVRPPSPSLTALIESCNRLAVAMEGVEGYRGILLHVEDDESLCGQ
jgi:hypothetical protein